MVDIYEMFVINIIQFYNLLCKKSIDFFEILL